MGIYLNPGNQAFAEALNSEIYVDKSGLIDIQIKYWAQMPGLYVTVVHADSGNLLR